MGQEREVVTGASPDHAALRGRLLGARRLAEAGTRAWAAALPAAALALLLGYGHAACADPLAQPVPPQYRLDTLAPGPAVATLPGVSSLSSGSELVYHLPASFRFDSLSGINVEDLSDPLDHPRATYRYTWLSQPGWDVKIGLSTSLDTGSAWQRFIAASPTDYLHVGALPTMHLSGQSQLADRWLLSVSAEGLWTARGQALDMDLRVDYSLTRNVALFGSYRLTDSIGDGTEAYGFVPSNAAQFGVRLRF